VTRATYITRLSGLTTPKVWLMVFFYICINTHSWRSDYEVTERWRYQKCCSMYGLCSLVVMKDWMRIQHLAIIQQLPSTGQWLYPFILYLAWLDIIAIES